MNVNVLTIESYIYVYNYKGILRVEDGGLSVDAQENLVELCLVGVRVDDAWWEDNVLGDASVEGQTCVCWFV